MDKCNTDAEFDSYWDSEAKNNNRNRIRVGRQYQASIPPLLKPGEKDGRKSAELETLKWKPGQLTDQEVEDYLCMAKGVGLFSKSLGSNASAEKSDNTLQSAIKGLSEFVTSHHPCHHDDGCKVSVPSSSGETGAKLPSDWTPSEAQLFARALESCGKNFCAIKKDYLPWKPVRSIIEYYYQGKSEKPEDQSNAPDEISPKKEDSPGPSCSTDEKPRIKEEPPPGEGSPKCENPPDSAAVNFLESTRVTDPCGAVFEPKMTVDESNAAMASFTVGSLKFFLGGRLVLKLNAQQDSGSGTKCQWVQSKELQPKNQSGARKERHRKKKNNSLPPQTTEGGDSKPRKEGKPKVATPESSLPVKKAKLLPESEFDFAPEEKSSLLLCSSSWTPPVADGQEACIEMDDGSSKTSEGYISPVTLSDDQLRFANSPDCKSYRGSPNGSPFKPDGLLLGHKSALRSPVRTPHRSSPLLKTWSRWPSSPSSLSPVSVADLKTKDNPLDLSSKASTDLSSDSSNQQTTSSNKLSPDADLDSSQSSSFPGAPVASPKKDPEGHSPCPTDPPCGEGGACCCCCDAEDRNLPYQCALSKCTKDYSLEEVPLDLSSASDSVNDRTDISETISDTANDVQNSEAVERGMLYQLLKNNTGGK